MLFNANAPPEKERKSQACNEDIQRTAGKIITYVIATSKGGKYDMVFQIDNLI